MSWGLLNLLTCVLLSGAGFALMRPMFRWPHEIPPPAPSFVAVPDATLDIQGMY